MSDNENNFDPFPTLSQTLTKHAEYLNAISSTGWWPKVFYEIMSGALVWSDEMMITMKMDDDELIDALRGLFAYRTSLMLNTPRLELKAVWDHGY